MNYRRNLRYFRGMKIIWAILLVVFGIMIAIDESLRGYGVLMIVAGILWFIAVINMTPTDEEIDSVTKAFKKSIQEDAIRKLKDSYDELGVKKPVIIGGYHFKPFGDMRLLFKRGRDGKRRSSLYTESLFLFTDNQLVHRRLVFSIVQPAVNTSTEEYYYDDIVTIKSHETDSKPFSERSDYRGPQVTMRTIELVTKGGSIASFSFRNIEEVDAVVEHMKKMIRVRKVSADTQNA